MNVKDIRRFNLRKLAEEIGGITALAKNLNKSQSQISHLIGTRPIKNIGDKLAAEIEQAFSKSPGWLDREHYFVAEERGIYVIDNQDYRPIYWAPVIEWQEILVWPTQQKQLKEKAKNLVPIQAERNSDIFALRMNQTALTALEDHKLNFPRDTVLVVDPHQKPKKGSYAIATLPTSSEPILGHYEEKNGTPSLRQVGAPEEIALDIVNIKLLGVVRQILLTMP